MGGILTAVMCAVFLFQSCWLCFRFNLVGRLLFVGGLLSFFSFEIFEMLYFGVAGLL